MQAVPGRRPGIRRAEAITQVLREGGRVEPEDE